jgi:hypothetical protein
MATSSSTSGSLKARAKKPAPAAPVLSGKRLPDAEATAREYARFVDDLRSAPIS